MADLEMKKEGFLRVLIPYITEQHKWVQNVAVANHVLQAGHVLSHQSISVDSIAINMKNRATISLQ